MPTYVKDGSTWKSSLQIFVKDSATWKEAKEVWIKDAGTWKRVHNAEIMLNIGANTADYNIKAAALASGWNGVTKAIVNVNVATNAIVYASSNTTNAMDTGNGWPTGSAINIYNNGYIVGCGGSGGAGGTGAFDNWPGSPGRAGGTALIAREPIVTVYNYGTIGGGGGGGGGGTSDVNSNPSYAVGGGGGGGGRTGLVESDGAPHGASPDMTSPIMPYTNDGANGTFSGAGAGGTSSAGDGGPGGGWGAVGSGGGGSSGGAAGKYLAGIANVTFAVTGTVLGPTS